MHVFIVTGMGSSGFGIRLDYPAWFLLFCILAGGIYAGILYFRNRSDGFSILQSRVFATFRFLAVTLLAFLLLGPLAERLIRQVEEPLLIFAQDNTGSLLIHDGEFDRSEYLAGKKAFLEDMERHFQVRVHTFGEAFRMADSIGFDERLTDMAEVFSGIEQQYSNRNIGAVIVAGDGIYNRGIKPLYAAAGQAYPVYTIALGDTVPRRDLLLNRVNHNRITYLGNDFPVEMIVEAMQADGISSLLTITRDGETLFSEVLSFSGDYDQKTLLAELTADKPGMQRYRASIAAVEGEISLANNSRDFYIDVIDGRQQVLILSQAPHPDVGAIRMALGENENYEVSHSLIADFDGNIQAFNMLILHQLPAPGRSLAGLMEQVAAAELPCLFIVGQQTDLAAYNNLRTGLAISPRSGDFTEVLPALNPAFPLFSLPENTSALLSSLPPLFSPFARHTLAAGAQVLLFQRIGQVVSEQPLVVFSQAGGWKTGVISGEGVWRWRLATYSRTASHAAFDELISRVIQFMSVREDRSLFRVQAEQFIYENEEVRLEAELYNRSYELINEPEVSLVITSGEGVDFPYQMSRTSNAYQLIAGTFPPGEYAYLATTSFGGERFAAEGRFTVSPLSLEELRTIADHNLMFQLAEQSGGAMFYPGQWQEIQQHLTGRDDLLPVMYTSKKFDELINLKFLFFLILVLLTGEWFMRKRSGSY
jgi:hypothetical protein